MERITDQTYELPTGYPMPVPGLGTWQLAGVACERAVRQAIELGYRHIDAAELVDSTYT